MIKEVYTFYNFKISIFALILILLSSCKKNENQVSKPIQYLLIYRDEYDMNDQLIARIPAEPDSIGNFYFFNDLILDHFVFCDEFVPPYIFCLSPQSVDSIYFPFKKSPTIWSKSAVGDTIFGLVNNPGETVYYPTVKKFNLTLIKYNYLRADTFQCQ